MLRRAYVLLLCAAFAGGLAAASLPTQAPLRPAAATIAVTPGCTKARAAVTTARLRVKRATSAVRHARTARAKRLARARLTKAKKTLTVALRTRDRLCRPTTPTTPTTPTSPTTPITGSSTTPTVPTTPTPPTPPVNHPPAINGSGATVHTDYTFDAHGLLTAASTQLSIPPASDPDGDTLAYQWTGPAGVAGAGTSATWTRTITDGRPDPGTVTVTVSDGRGGSASYDFVLGVDPVNRPPSFPSPLSSNINTVYHYDGVGRLYGATTTIAITTPPTDPDGDPLSYGWTATNGSIGGDGLTGTWERLISYGRVATGTATITVTDGQGGSATFSFVFH